MNIAHKLSEGKATVTDIIKVLTPAIRGGGNNVDEKKVAEMIWDATLVDGMRCAGEVLSKALNSGSGDEGNEQAEESPT